MKKKTASRSVFQAILDEERRRKLAVIADRKGVPMSSMLRIWIDREYSRIENK
jgi:hypothetical protein